LLADDVVVRPAAECKQQDRDNEERDEEAPLHRPFAFSTTDISAFAFSLG